MKVSSTDNPLMFPEKVSREILGTLKVVSGTIMAGDPGYLALDYDKDFVMVTGAAIGEFPLVATVYHYPGDHRVIAEVEIVFSQEKGKRKLVGTMPVDGGMACFTDSAAYQQFRQTDPKRFGVYIDSDRWETAKIVKKEFGVDYVEKDNGNLLQTVQAIPVDMEKKIRACLSKEFPKKWCFSIKSDTLEDEILAGFTKAHPGWYSFFNLQLDPIISKANLIAFTSGFGDGGYGVYGYYKSGSLVKVGIEMVEKIPQRSWFASILAFFKR